MVKAQKIPDVTLPAEFRDGDTLSLPDGRVMERVDGQWQEVPPDAVAGDPTCNADPCAKHGRCHCMCPCFGGDGPDDCDDCLN